MYQKSLVWMIRNSGLPYHPFLLSVERTSAPPGGCYSPLLSTFSLDTITRHLGWADLVVVWPNNVCARLCCCWIISWLMAVLTICAWMWVCLQHFVCAKCEKPFLGHRHYERKGLAYCETHYNQVTWNMPVMKSSFLVPIADGERRQSP